MKNTCILLLLMGVRQLLTAQPVLLKDINLVRTGSPSLYTASPYDVYSPGAAELPDGKWLFPAYTPESGVELYRWDPATASVRLVKDLFRGTASSYPYNLTVVGNTAYFGAVNSVSEGYELWKSDGTAAGTTMLAALTPGMYTDVMFTPLGVLGTELVFAANNQANGLELWKTDGTTAGTVLLKDIQAGAGSGLTTGITGVVWGGFLYFRASNGFSGNGEELWKTDGTSGGTVLVKDIQAGTGSSSPEYLTLSGSTLYFFASTAANGYELWKSDGTDAGTLLVKDLNGTAAGGIWAAAGMVPIGSGSVVFAGNVSGSGIEPYLSDGTSGGTALLADVNAGSGTGVLGKFVAADAGAVYFIGSTAASGQELWRTDGTPSGTVQVSDLQPGSGNGAFYFYGMAAYNGSVYFAGAQAGTNYELWKSDGTAPVLVKEIRAGVSSSNLRLMKTGSNGIFCWANNGLTADEPWFTDGTPAGTMQVADINQANNGASGVYFYPIAAGSQTFFMANDGVLGLELYRTDGTPAGTALVKDINPGAANGLDVNYGTNYLMAMNGIHYFPATDGTSGYELWRSDGTEAGTWRVKDIAPGAANGIEGYNQELFAASSGLLYFAANDGVNGLELWKSDGTESGTQLVLNLNGLTIQPNFTEYNGFVYFTATLGSDQQWWRTDGSAAGTTLVANLEPNPARYDNYGRYCVHDNKLFFTAYTFANGTELYVYDGATVSMVADLYPGTSSGFPNSSNPTGLISYNGSLWFSATNGTSGYELWKSDGTAGGTGMLMEIAPGNTSGFNGVLWDGIQIVNGKMVFIGFTADEGEEPWVSDGIPAGTFPLATTYPGSSGTSQWAMFSDGNHAFFTAAGLTGQGIWQTDGTPAGTFPAAKGLYANFHNACMMGSTLIASGNMFTSAGNELYAYTAFDPVVETVANQVVVADAQFVTGNWTYYYHAATDKVLFAVEKLGEPLGNTWDGGFVAQTHTLAGLGSGNALPFTNTIGYASNPNWYGMHRNWELTPLQQPTDSVRVRFFYTAADLADIQGTLPEMDTDQELVFFKLNGVPMPSPYHDHSGISTANYQQYLHGPSASTTTWTSGTWRGLRYAEFVVSSFSGGGGGGGAGGLGAFPVEWLFAEATARPQAQAVDIRWGVADSRNVDRFEVEFSTNGLDFERVATILPGDVRQQYYGTTHFPPVTGRLYYRIRQTDADGTLSWSNTLEAGLEEGGEAGWLFPNPADYQVIIPGGVCEACTIRVMDLTGREMLTISGTGTDVLDVSRLPAGMYQVRVGHVAGLRTYRLMVKH